MLFDISWDQSYLFTCLSQLNCVQKASFACHLPCLKVVFHFQISPRSFASSRIIYNKLRMFFFTSHVIMELVQRLDTSIVTDVTGFPMPVPHTRPFLVTPHGLRK